ncbi:CRP/FNR family transcriptional regulator OS=Castellaniella defragrans OX=75697 GN=HNR28_000832 PE=4 SV=1 [Castellaniella defragrans]
MLNAICLPLGMAHDEIVKMDELIKERIRVPKGGALYHQGDASEALYGLRSGSIKTQIQDAHGQIQITGFLLPGEILGLDALMENTQVSHAIAMEDSEVCIIRLDEVDQLASKLPILQTQLRRLMSKEISRSHSLLMALGGLRSEQRVAAFLLNLSQRLHVLGYSPSTFIMRMSREDIGNFLGLTLETVSRLFSRFARDGILRVQHREINILDMHALQVLAGTDCA